MAAGLFVVGRIEGIERPALAPTLPTIDGKGFVLLDVGANSDAKPEHLLQFAIMGSVYAQKVRGIEKPRVGLLNIGTEEKKGNELTKHAFTLLQQSSEISFIGNVEARDLLNGPADVVVTDGFTGNVVLKASETLAESMLHLIKVEITRTPLRRLGAFLARGAFRAVRRKTDPSEHGGAPLLGVRGCCVIGHGRSSPKAIATGVRLTARFARERLVSRLQDELLGTGATRATAPHGHAE